jgi:hypothetical protein
MPGALPFAIIRGCQYLYNNVDFYLDIGKGIMDKTTQISALISQTTRELLERHVRATGVKKGHLVEQALRHHLLALQALPTDIIVHPRLVVTRRSGEAILREIEQGKPTDALRDLMRDGD